MQNTGTWGGSSSATVRKPSNIYADPTQQPQSPQTSGAGMYQTPAFGGGAPLDFSGLDAGGTAQSGDTSFSGPNQTGMYQAFKGSQSQDLGNILNLAGTGLQTKAQMYGADQALAGTGLQTEAARKNQAFKEAQIWPFLKQLIPNLSGGGSSSIVNQFATAGGASPMDQQAAINAAEANAARSVEEGEQDSLRSIAGSGWGPSSPVGIAADAARRAGAVGQSEAAKRGIRDEFGNRRVGNLATAMNAEAQKSGQIYDLLRSLMS